MIEKEREALDATKRSSEEAYWSARLAARRSPDRAIGHSAEFDPRSTEEVLAGEADTIFAEIQARLGDARRDPNIAKINRKIAQDNVRLRARFLDEVEVLPTPDAARHVREDAATLDRWRAQGQVIGVPVGAAWLFPTFQFKDGVPRPVIARALAELPASRSPWETAWWFVSSNSWLGGPPPIRFLDDSPDAVVWAAAHESDEIGG